MRPVLVDTAKNKQTTGLGHVTVADMKRILVCWPGEEVLEAFDRIIGPIFDSAFEATLESRDLATLRVTLLQMLLSGELSVPTSFVRRSFSVNCSREPSNTSLILAILVMSHISCVYKEVNRK